MKKLRKIGALLLALVMVLATATAFGAASLGTSSNIGEAGTWTADDTPIPLDKSVIIRKEITAFNPDEGLIYGPEIVYTYGIASASDTELVTITDETGDHASGLQTTTTALGATAITSGTPTLTGTGENVIAWTNADILEASSTGIANYKNLTIDFSSVVFSQPGVYRYKITETPDAYTTSGVTGTTGTHIRYLDVYVMRSSLYGKTADGSATSNTNASHWWTIYGYVCIDSTLGTAAVSPSTKKTSGFVAKSEDEGGTTGTTTADQYHTYNLTVGKTLTGDTTMNGHPFPFDVAWTAGAATETFRFAVETTGTASVTNNAQAATTTVNGTTVDANTLYYTTASDAVGTADKDGTPLIAHNGTVKYIGIPNGTKVTVKETNDVTGTTYSTRVFANTYTTTYTAPTTQVAFTGGTAVKGTENSIENALATMDQDDTAIYAQASAPAADSNQAIQFTNTLAIISPTGYVSRFAPYALILVGGIVLLIISRKHKKHTDEE